LFLGPTGSGKTRVVEATAESLCGDARAVIKIDCGEFQHSHEIAKLIGSPPGYLGHRETHAALSQEALNRYQTDTFKLSFVLFDEIEKASDALWNLLLGILDKATLTLGDNRRVDFSRSMIFMTSNLGAAEMGQMMQPRFGFSSADAERSRLEAVDQKLTEKISRAGLEAARRKFTPEFMNRIDRTVVFKPLGRAELRRILAIELNAVQQRITDATATQPWVFSVTEPGKEYLLREGADLKYGARHLKRSIERHLVNPFSNLVATGQVKGGDWILVDFDEELGVLTFSKDTSWPAAAVVGSRSAHAPLSADPLASTAAEEPARWFRTRNQRR
jgi:ATP-dependent Clp protease ATP-binding subunit ClpA